MFIFTLLISFLYLISLVLILFLFSFLPIFYNLLLVVFIFLFLIIFLLSNKLGVFNKVLNYKYLYTILDIFLDILGIIFYSRNIKSLFKYLLLSLNLIVSFISTSLVVLFTFILIKFYSISFLLVNDLDIVTVINKSKVRNRMRPYSPAKTGLEDVFIRRNNLDSDFYVNDHLLGDNILDDFVYNPNKPTKSNARGLCRGFNRYFNILGHYLFRGDYIRLEKFNTLRTHQESNCIRLYLLDDRSYFFLRMLYYIGVDIVDLDYFRTYDSYFNSISKIVEIGKSDVEEYYDPNGKRLDYILKLEGVMKENVNKFRPIVQELDNHFRSLKR